MSRLFLLSCALIVCSPLVSSQPQFSTIPVPLTPSTESFQVTSVTGTHGVESVPLAFSWTPVGGAQSYRLQVSANPNFTNLIVDSVSAAASINLPGVPDQSVIYWRVNATIDASPGDWSIPLRFSSIQQSGNAGSAPLVRATDGVLSQVSVPFIPSYLANAVWGDYDNDGDLDALVVGDNDGGNGANSHIYRNDNGTFVDIGAQLPPVSRGKALWGDYDNDGNLDILLYGTYPNGTLNYVTVMHNDNGIFTTVVTNIPAGQFGDVAWVDYDGDGDLDIALTATQYTGPNQTGVQIAKIYRNDNGAFVDINQPLTGLAECAVTWADVNGDGSPDLLMTGMPQSWSGPVTLLYLNNHGTFTSAPISLPGVWARPAIACADVDNDGDLDVMISGHTGPNDGTGGLLTQLYLNNGGTFVNSANTFPGLSDAAIAWGDIDNDGDPDVAVSGWDGSNTFTGIYRNDNGAFVQLSESVVNTFIGSLSWGDYDNDGDLDLLLTGSTIGSISPTTRLYRNTSGTNLFSANSIPAAPPNLRSAVNGSQVTLSWDRGGDAETPAHGLSYNLRIGSSPGAGDIMPPMSLGSGHRGLAAPGNACADTFWTVKNLPPGLYYWSVQSIDGSLAGSPFALEQFFGVGTQISGTKFNDLNGNGIRDLGEPGIPSWPIQLTLSVASPPPPVLTTTDATGNYVFQSLSAGTYQVNEGSSPGWTQTYPPGLSYSVSLSQGQQANGRDFGNHNVSAPLSIGLHMSPGWNIVSLPVVVANRSANSVFGSPHRTSNLYEYLEGAGFHVADTLKYGQGYYVSWNTDEVFTVTGTELNHITTGVTPGWNLIGSLSYPLPTANLTPSGTALEPNFWGPTSRGLRIVEAIPAGKGAWVYASSAGTVDGVGTACFAQTPPEFSEPSSPDCGSDLLATVGTTLQFPVVVKDQAGGSATLTVSGLPAGAVLTPSLPITGPTDNTMFYWTPTHADSGVHVVRFEASNSCGIISSCSYAIIVQSQTEFAVPLTATQNSTQRTVYVGVSTEATACIDSGLGEKRIPRDEDFGMVLANLPGHPCPVGNTLISDLRPFTSVTQTDTFRVFITPATADPVVLSWPDLNHDYTGSVLLKNGAVTIDMKAQTTYVLPPAGGSVQIIATGPSYSPPPPTVTTLPASNVGQTSAQLNGTVDANGVASTTAQFQWGETIAYGNVTSPTAISTGGIRSLTAPVSGLQSSHTYHFRAVAQNPNGVSYGGDLTWTTSSASGLTEVSVPFSSGAFAVWGDYDNDGDLDLLLIGGRDSNIIQPTRLYRNDGGTLVDVGITFPSGSSAAWGDFDNDGDLDLAITGATGLNNSLPSTKIFRNDNGTFVDINAGLLGLAGGNILWGDYDNDGDLDLLVCGSTDNGGTFYTKLYRNDHGVFVDANAGLPGVWGSSLAFGDYDNDGDLDIALLGYGDLGVTTMILKNTNGVFSNSGITLPQVNSGALAWGDYDNDGKLDLFLSGTLIGTGGAPLTKIYHNTGSGFVDINAPIAQLCVTGVAWGDVDNDGDLDLVYGGSQGFDHSAPMITKLYRNDGGTFTDTFAPLPGTWFTSVAWGDYDNDRDLDLIITGPTSNVYPYNFIAKLFRNDAPTTNTRPSVPPGLSALVAGSDVTLTWNGSVDAQTPGLGLTYNLRIGTTPSGSEIMSPHASISTGVRTVADMGNVDHRRSWTIRNLPNGTYYWGVQSVDKAYAGSLFATGSPFTVIGGGGGSTIQIPLAVTETGGAIQPGIKPTSKGVNATVSASFGFGTLATYCRDAALGEFNLPPLPPPGVFDVRFLDPRGANVACFDQGMNWDFRQFISSSQIDTYLVRFQPGSGTYPMTISWPDLGPYYTGPVTLTNANGSTPVLVDMIASRSVLITDITTNAVRIVARGPSLTPIPLQTYRTFGQGEYVQRAGWMRFYPPTGGNVMDTVFERMGWKAHGFFIGIPSPIHSRATPWVLIRNYSPYLRRFLPQTGPPRGFDTYGGIAWHGFRVAPLPAMHNNHLAGEQFALKFNIAASDLQITPSGFGDLIYNDPASPSNYCNGKSIRQIMAHVDSALSFWKSYPLVHFFQLDSALTKINAAFQGPIVRLSTSPLKIDGVASLSTVSFLFKTSNPPVVEDLSATVEDIPVIVPEVYSLYQNYPNPFNPTTVIRYDLPSPAYVTLKIYNLLGQEVATLMNGERQDIGQQEREFDAGGLPSGLYLYRLDAVDEERGTPVYHETKKMLLVK